MRLRPAGDLAVLVELPDNAAVHRFAGVVRRTFGDHVEDVVPGHLALLVSWRPGTGDPDDLTRRLAALELPPVATGAAGTADHDLAHELLIPVTYDGADLDEIAALAGLPSDAIPELHTAVTYSAAFIGFAPGFAYLIGGDPRLDIPRRATPRTHVPAGAVAIAAGYSAVYPSDGPGGWHVIGHTTIPLFDVTAAQPALITPGTRVRFEVARR